MILEQLHAVTGAFGYSGKYIAQRLLDAGVRVMTLTNSPHRPNPFGERVKVFPFNFDDPARLEESLRGVTTLYNTYWVRFNHKTFTHSMAVENTLRLFEAAKRAGVQRIVHISITNPDERSPLEYFAGKGRLEHALDRERNFVRDSATDSDLWQRRYSYQQHCLGFATSAGLWCV